MVSGIMRGTVGIRGGSGVRYYFYYWQKQIS